MFTVTTYDPSTAAEEFRLSADDIHELARGLVNEKYIHSSQVPESLWHSVFLPLDFGDDLFNKKLRDAGLMHIIGDTTCKGAMTIDGFPMMYSCRFILDEDNKRILKRVATILEVLDGIRNDD